MHTPSDHDHLRKLFVLNIVLQIFDGVATYQGLQMGWQEANPLLAAAFELFGVEPALLFFKIEACGLLWLLHRAAPLRVGITVLRLLAAVYCTLSLAPWMGKFLWAAVSIA